jgi:predicted site-specific integrase-resolvase
MKSLIKLSQMIDLTQINPDILYSPNDLSKIFKVSPITLRYYIKKGYLPAVKFGNRFFVKGSDLLKVFQPDGEPKKIVLKVQK